MSFNQDLQLNNLTSSIAINTIDSTTFAQTWNWTTATTQNPLSLNANALTTGNLLSLSGTALTTGAALSINGGAGNGISSPATIALKIITGTTGTLTLDSGTTGAINLGTNANAKTITIGNSTGATAVSINNGTGTLNLGTNAIAHTVSIGNATGATAITYTTGTGAHTFNSSVVTANALNYNLNSITTGAGMNINLAVVTTGIGFSLTSAFTGLNSTNGFFRVFNNAVPTTGTGIFARIQPSSIAGSGLTMFNNGNNGFGTATPNSTLQITGSLATNYRNITAVTTITDTDYTIHITGTGVFTQALLATATRTGRVLIFTNEGTGLVTLQGNGAELIGSLNTYTLPAGASVNLQSTGTKWIITAIA